MGNMLTLNVANGPNITGNLAQPTITCLLGGKRQELKVRTTIDGKEETPLFDVLKRFKDGDSQRGIEPNPDFKIIIRADQDTEYRFLEPVLAECTRAGVNYDFATQRGEAVPQ
jgi:hypothetical protein